MADLSAWFTGGVKKYHKSMNDYYTYAYLREDKTPYYIGKGRGRRVYSNSRRVHKPPRDRILILKCNLTEEEAHRHEVYMISLYGRKDNNTGILRNLTDGGEGASGRKISESTRLILSDQKKGDKNPNYNKVNPFKGKSHTPEAKEKMRLKKLGRKLPEETKQKMRKPRQPGLKRNCKPRGPMSEETKRKISEGRRRNHASPEVYTEPEAGIILASTTQE